MSAKGQQFRGSAIGGFNRQDVILYIENITRENSTRIGSLEKELADTKQQNTSMARELSTYRAEHSGRQETMGQLSTDLEYKTEVLSQTSEALSKAERENAALRDKMKKMEEATAAYDMLKEMAGTIELEARNRAQRIIQNAEASAKLTRNELEQWMYLIQVNYARLRQEIEAMLGNASSEMNRTKTTFDQISQGLSEQDETLKLIIEQYRKSNGVEQSADLTENVEEAEVF